MFDFGYGMMGGSISVIWLIFWFLAFIGLVLLFKNQWECSKARKEGSAIEILKIRYAKGEINKEEFEAKKKDLM
jgi:putative membrane protein